MHSTQHDIVACGFDAGQSGLWIRMAACVGLSLLLHAGLMVMVSGDWLAMISRPAVLPALEVRLPRPMLPPAPMVQNDPLLKDTLSDSPVPVTAAAVQTPTPRASAAGAALPRTREVARERAAERKLAEHLYYPPEAVAAGIEGEVRLLLTLDPAGNVLEVVIASGSGHAVLDRAALAAANAIRRLPGAGKRELILPVVFRLE